MMIWCGHTERLLPETVESLKATGREVEYTDVTGDHTAAWREIKKRWTMPGDFAHLDQDIIVHPWVFDEFEECREPWCSFPFLLTPEQPSLLTRGTGCVRYTEEARKAATVELIESQYGSCWECGGVIPGCYRHIDGRISDSFMSLGIDVHVHNPPVGHIHY